MNNDQIRAMFPIDIEVTQEILDKSDVGNIKKCIGATTLKTILKDIPDIYVSWGRKSGHIQSINEDEPESVDIETDVDMMEITEPCTVTFKLLDYDKREY